MIFLKSIFAGLLAVVIAAMVLPMIVCVYLTSRLPRDQETAVGFDLVAAARLPVTWIIVAIVFALGFYWEYRRLKAP